MTSGTDRTGSRRRPLRVLHTADVHLGGHPPTGPDGPHRQDCLCPLDAVVSLAVAHAADALLIVGDLFDHARVDGPVVGAAFELLAGLDIPVVLMVGNHDVLDERSIYHRCADAVTGAGVHFVDDHGGGN